MKNPIAKAAAPAAATADADIVFRDGVAIFDNIGVTYDPDAAVPRGGSLKVVGRDLQQTGFAGLDMTPGKTRVGPAHAVYVAVNVAAQAGRKKVSASGVTQKDQDRLKPWLEKVKDQIEVSFL